MPSSLETVQKTVRVSVCLPVYNGAAFLEEAIESVLTQTLTDFELLISDDHSTDNSPAIIESYASQDKRIVNWRNDRCHGLFANYNLCLERASGEYIKPFAQDDIWAEDLLLKQAQLLDEHPEVALVAARRVLVDELGEMLNEVPLDLEDSLGIRQVYETKKVLKTCMSHPLNNLIGEPCAVMFREIFKGSGFDNRYRHAGDLEYWMRILRNGNLGMVRERLVFFRRHGKSATSGNINRLWAFTDMVHLAEQAAEVLEEMGSSREIFLRSAFTAASHCLPRLTNGEVDLATAIDRNQCSGDDIAALQQSLALTIGMLTHSPSAPHGSDTELQLNERRIQRSEKTLQLLLGSPYWQATRLLRECNRLLSTGQAKSSHLNKTEKQDTPLQRQISYLQYLQCNKKLVVKSRSWRISRVLRGLFKRNMVITDSAPVSPDASKKKQKLAPEVTAKVVATKRPAAAATAPTPVVQKSNIPTDWKRGGLRWTIKAGFLNRPYDVVLAIHEASRTGAPSLGLALARTFRDSGLNCLIVLKKGGELTDEFSKTCDVLNLSLQKDPAWTLYEELESLLGAGLLKPQTKVFLNSAVLFDLSVPFKKHGMFVVSLIHEFVSMLSDAERDCLFEHSDLNIFSSKFTLDEATKLSSGMAQTHIVQQGLIDPLFGTYSRQASKAFLKEKFDIKPETFVVLACGSAELRKGIDHFVTVAGQLLSNTRPKPDLKFIWVGGHKVSLYDAYWWALRDTEKLGLDKDIFFLESQEDIQPYFAAADLFLLPSREDPLPCVLHFAHASSLPVVAFEKSGGVHEVLSEGGGTLVPYGDINAMAEVLRNYYDDRQTGTTHGAQGKALVSTKYLMANYAASLLDLAEDAKHLPISKREVKALAARSKDSKPSQPLCNRKPDTEETGNISVVIPVYNGKSFLRETVLSVAKQTLRPKELIIVDDGSTDDSLDTIKDLQLQFPLICLRKENEGQAAARNFGAQVAQGDFLAFLDQDDIWYPEHLEQLLKPFSTDQFERIGWTYSNFDEIDGRGRMTERRCLDSLPFEHPKVHLERMLGEDMHVLPSATLIRTKVFRHVGGFDPQFVGYEDDDLFLRIFLAGFGNTYIAEALSQWRIHSRGTSYGNPIMDASLIAYVKKLSSTFSDKGDRHYITQHVVPRFVTATMLRFDRAVTAKDFARAEKVLDHLRIAFPDNPTASEYLTRDFILPALKERLNDRYYLAAEVNDLATMKLILSHSNYLSENLAATDKRETINKPIKLPPPELRFLVTGTENAGAFSESGSSTASAILDTLRANSVELDSLPNILDFGCGCGRVLTQFAQRVKGTVHGTDINPHLIGWLRSNSSKGTFHLNELKPPVTSCHQTFDLIYAISVFTHLTEEQQIAWMDEFSRLVKPGGYLIITTHGNHPQYRQALTTDELQSFDDGNMIVRNSELSGSNQCATYQQEQHVRKTLLAHFDLVSFREFACAGAGKQDIYLLKNKPVR